MQKKIVKYALIVVVDLIVIFFALDLLLNLFDPLGILALQSTSNAMIFAGASHPEWGYVFNPGTHDLYTFTATINSDYSRYVPATMPGRPCNITFVGDSLTFGWGVNDDETWVNLLASELPDVSVKLVAFPGWNAANVISALSTLEADGFVWLHWENDNGFKKVYNEADIDNLDFRPAVVVYYKSLYKSHSDTQPNPERERAYQTAIESVHPRDDLLVLAQTTDLIAADWMQRVEAPITVETRISIIDGHPNAAGNVIFADAIRPYAFEFIEQQCEQAQ